MLIFPGGGILEYFFFFVQISVFFPPPQISENAYVTVRDFSGADKIHKLWQNASPVFWYKIPTQIEKIWKTKLSEKNGPKKAFTAFVFRVVLYAFGWGNFILIIV